ncbi:hypothetical protein RFI_11141, partial [Reticulomyxa filosa]
MFPNMRNLSVDLPGFSPSQSDPRGNILQDRFRLAEALKADEEEDELADVVEILTGHEGVYTNENDPGAAPTKEAEHIKARKEAKKSAFVWDSTSHYKQSDLFREFSRTDHYFPRIPFIYQIPFSVEEVLLFKMDSLFVHYYLDDSRLVQRLHRLCEKETVSEQASSLAKQGKDLKEDPNKKQVRLKDNDPTSNANKDKDNEGSDISHDSDVEKDAKKGRLQADKTPKVRHKSMLALQGFFFFFFFL